ncbi:MAG: EamA family transporter RarD [Ilumatobacteraceae bacterium]
MKPEPQQQLDQVPLHQKGVVAGVAAYLVWGALTLYWRHLEAFDAVELIGWRVICSAVVMATVLTVTKRWQHLHPILTDRRLLGSVVLSALILTINWTTYVWSVVHDHVIETALGYFLAPLGTIALGVVVLNEKLSRAQEFVFVLAAVAVGILTYSYGRVPWLAVIIAISWVAYGFLKKRVPLTPVESMAAESFLVLVPAIVAVSVLAGRATSIPHTASGAQFALVLCSGLATIVPLTLFAYAAQRTPLRVMGPLNYIVPTINFGLGWLVFHESLPPTRVAGFALVWVGLAIATADAARRSRSRSDIADPVPV